jgi:predicted aspartyl protease
MICGYAILDTGANRTYVAPRVIEQLGLKKVGMHQMVGATGSGTGDVFAAMLSLTFDDEGSERERFFDIQAIAGSMLASDAAPLAYVGRDILARLASMRLDFEAGILELVANETSGREF